jgi:hypothetical protein
VARAQRCCSIWFPRVIWPVDNGFHGIMRAKDRFFVGELFGFVRNH